MLQPLTEQQYSINCRKADVVAAMQSIQHAFGRSQAAFSGMSYSLSKCLERRRAERVAVEIPIYIRPVTRCGRHISILDVDPIMGLTQDLSTEGFGFRYDQSIRSKHMLVEFDLYNAGSLQLVVELRWSRKKASHAFVGGVLVIGIVE